MKSVGNKRRLTLILAVVMVLCSCVTAYAYNTYGGYVLTGGIKGQTYYISLTDYWRKPFTNAFDNWYNTPTSFSFSEATSLTSTKIDCYIYSADDNSNGYTELYIPGSGFTGSVPSSDWLWAKVYLNTKSLANTIASYDNGVAGHEVGYPNLNKIQTFSEEIA